LTTKSVDYQDAAAIDYDHEYRCAEHEHGAEERRNARTMRCNEAAVLRFLERSLATSAAR